jgi:hypothetical protein
MIRKCQKQMFGLRLASARMTEMGIAEACCVFEPVAECAISSNMNDPDRADRKEEHIGEQRGPEKKENREGERVHKIIARRPDAGVIR